ncbi:MAG: hypothetical protein HC849_24165 [Oscillatoriales cyanobacterium RU_3_3]|nr:hypothetical protein [Oscillatoriales cyanobacterium RU_3_3]
MGFDRRRLSGFSILNLIKPTYLPILNAPTLHVWATEGCARSSKGRATLKTPIASALLKETDSNCDRKNTDRWRFLM